MSNSVVYRTLSRAAHGVEPSMVSAWRRATVAAASDDTAASARRRCLVVAPHPDDETIGCGATIARKRASGTSVRVLVVADGRHAQSASTLVGAAQLGEIRSREVVEACAALGVAGVDVIQLHHEDTHVAEVEREVVEEIAAAIDEFEPDEVLVASGLDHHPDHRVVNRATHAALRRVGRPVVVGEFPVWSWIDGPWLDQRGRNPVGRALHLAGQPLRALLSGRARTVSTVGFLDAKRNALAAHASQTTHYTDEAEWAVMDDSMLAPFLSDFEVFLPSRPSLRKDGSC